MASMATIQLRQATATPWQSSTHNGCIHDNFLIVSDSDPYDRDGNNVSYPAMQMGLRS